MGDENAPIALSTNAEREATAKISAESRSRFTLGVAGLQLVFERDTESHEKARYYAILRLLAELGLAAR